MVTGLSISTGGVSVVSLSETFIWGLVLIQPMKTSPDITEIF